MSTSAPCKTQTPWRFPTVYEAKVKLYGQEKYYVGYATDLPTRNSEHEDIFHPRCAEILRGRNGGVEFYREFECGMITNPTGNGFKFSETGEEPELRRQARSRELVRAYQLIKRHGREYANGAIWCHHNQTLGGRIKSRIRAELDAADRLFSTLPGGEEAAYLPVQDPRWRVVEERVQEFANENARIQRFLDGEEEFAPRAPRQRNRAAPY